LKVLHVTLDALMTCEELVVLRQRLREFLAR
jgi:hypothetical protein